MTPRWPCLLLLLTTPLACGSRRVADYLDELEDCPTTSTTSTSTTAMDTTESSSTATADTSAASTTTASSTTAVAETTADTTTAATTGDPAPECGNGVLEPSGPEPEECDDGNLAPDDGCSATCARDVRVFVTSVVYQAGELQSLALADALCGNLADDQGWPDPISYRAWLSDSVTAARDRFTRGRGRLVMTNGLVLADSWTALLAGDLVNNFEVTETSETYGNAVWTGTRPDGTAVPDAGHCADWSTSSFQQTGYYGYSTTTTSEWTLANSDDNPSGCNSSYALYCMQSL